MTKLSFRVLYQWSPLHTYKLKKKKKEGKATSLDGWIELWGWEVPWYTKLRRVWQHTWLVFPDMKHNISKKIKSLGAVQQKPIHSFILIYSHTHMWTHTLCLSLFQTHSHAETLTWGSEPTWDMIRWRVTESKARVWMCARSSSAWEVRDVCVPVHVCVSACVSCKQSGGHWWCRLTGGINTQ